MMALFVNYKADNTQKNFNKWLVEIGIEKISKHMYIYTHTEMLYDNAEHIL
jgi:hypothetical protein